MGMLALTTANPKGAGGEATIRKIISPLSYHPSRSGKFRSQGILCYETYPFQLCIQNLCIISGFKDTGLASQIPFNEAQSTISRFT